MVSKFKLDTEKSTATKTAISRTIEIANNYAGELSIEVLPLSKIELDPENKRDMVLTLDDALNGIDKSDPDYEVKKQDWKSLESLAKTIRDDQLINPIYVYRYGNKCRLIAGERRTLASAIAGKKEIIARIAGQRPVGTKLRVLQWIENNERSNLGLAERISSLESIAQEYFKENNQEYNLNKLTRKLLSSLTGISETQARRYILIMKSSPEIKDAILTGKLENLKVIEQICSASTQDEQKELLKLALKGLSLESIVKAKKELENNPIKIIETRGRKKNNINLGKVKPKIAEVIVDALLSSKLIKKQTIAEIKGINDEASWDTHDSAEQAFKKILLLVEKEYSLQR